MTDKGLLLTKILELYPVKAEYVRAILDSHKIDEDGSIKAVHFFSKKMFLACMITEYLKLTGNHKLKPINLINEVLLYFSVKNKHVLQTELLEFFKTLYVDDALRNDDTININKLRSEVSNFFFVGRTVHMVFSNLMVHNNDSHKFSAQFPTPQILGEITIFIIIR